MTWLRRFFAAIATALALLFGLAPLAAADPIIDVSKTDPPAEVDMSWVSQDVLDKIPADQRASFEGHLKVSWRNCVVVLKERRDKGRIGITNGSCGAMDECTITSPGQCVGGVIQWILGTNGWTLRDLDLGRLANELAKITPEYTTSIIPGLDAFSDGVYNFQQGVDSARNSGAGFIGSTTAGFAQLSGVPGEVVQAVANPTGAADGMLNRWKEDVSKGMAEALGKLSEGLAFDASYTSFRDAYAAAAGIGLVLLAGGSIVAIVTWRRSELPTTEVLTRWGGAVLGGMLGLVFTPAMLYVVSDASNVLSDGMVAWMETDQATITGTLLDPYISMDTEHTLLGWLGVLLLILLMMVGAVMVTVTFAIQWLVAYLGGVGLGLLWGLSPLKGGRRRLAKAGAVVVGAILARPLMLFMLGVAMRITNNWAPSADGWSMDATGTFFGLVLSVGALIMACLTPAALVRFVPAMGSSHLGSSFAGGLAGGLAGAGMGASMLGSRMMALAPRGRVGGASMRSAASRRAGGVRPSAAGGGKGAPSGAGGKPSVGGGAGGAASGVDPSKAVLDGATGRSVESAKAGAGDGKAPLLTPPTDGGAGADQARELGFPGATMIGESSQPAADVQSAAQGGEASAMTGPGRVLRGADLARAIRSHAPAAMQGAKQAVSSAAHAGVRVARTEPAQRMVSTAARAGVAGAAMGAVATSVTMQHAQRAAHSAQVDEVK